MTYDALMIMTVFWALSIGFSVWCIKKLVCYNKTMDRDDVIRRIEIHISPQELRKIADNLERDTGDACTTYIYDKGEIRYCKAKEPTFSGHEHF